MQTLLASKSAQACLPLNNAQQRHPAGCQVSLGPPDASRDCQCTSKLKSCVTVCSTPRRDRAVACLVHGTNTGRFGSPVYHSLHPEQSVYISQELCNGQAQKNQSTGATCNSVFLHSAPALSADILRRLQKEGLSVGLGVTELVLITLPDVGHLKMKRQRIKGGSATKL